MLGFLLGKPFCKECIRNGWGCHQQGDCRCYTEAQIEARKKGEVKMKWIGLLVVAVLIALGTQHAWHAYRMGVDDPLSIAFVLGMMFVGLPVAGLVILMYAVRSIIRFLSK